MEKPMQTFQIRMDPDLIEEIEGLAAKLKLNRSQLIRNLIDTGLDDLRIAQRVGLVSLIGFMRNNDIKAESVLEMVVENSRG